MGADGPEVAVESMTGGAHGFHAAQLPCEFFCFCILQRIALGTNAGFNLDSLIFSPRPLPSQTYSTCYHTYDLDTQLRNTHQHISLAREKLLLNCGCPVVLAGRLALLVFAVLSIRSGHPTVEIDSPTARWVRRRDFHCE